MRLLRRFKREGSALLELKKREAVRSSARMPGESIWDNPERTPPSVSVGSARNFAERFGDASRATAQAAAAPGEMNTQTAAAPRSADAAMRTRVEASPAPRRGNTFRSTAPIRPIRTAGAALPAAGGASSEPRSHDLKIVTLFFVRRRTTGRLTAEESQQLAVALGADYYALDSEQDPNIIMQKRENSRILLASYGSAPLQCKFAVVI